MEKTQAEPRIPQELHIQLLGRFAVSVGEEMIPDDCWHSRRARSLVKLLALAPSHRLHRDQVIDSLWAGSDLAAAANNFHQTLYAARRVLDAAGSACLTLEDGFLSLAQANGQTLVVDVDQFEAAAARAKGAQTPQDFQAALALYTGDLLPDDLYDEWTLLRREALRQSYLQLLLDLARLYEVRQEYPQGIEALQRLLSVDPSREEAHAGLMRLYALSGQRQRAVRQYQFLRETLNKDLEAEPSPGTTQIYQDILSGHYSDFQPKAQIPNNLPHQVSPIIGREIESEELKQVILSDQTRLVTVTGPGGTGKTRLVLEVSQMLLPAFHHGVFFIEISSQMTPESLLSAIAHAVGLNLYIAGSTSPQPTENSLRDQISNFLQDKQILLILDSFESILEASNQIDDLLRATSSLKFLITSRSRLNIEGEMTFPLAGLAFPPKPESLDEAARYEAVDLFVHIARLTNPIFSLTSKNRSAVAEICCLTQGMPLGILLAAGWTGTLEVEEILSETRHSLDFLSSSWRNLPDRQRSIRATFEYSWSLLAEAQRKDLMYLSIFPGAFSAARALQVCSVSLLALKALIDQSLLQRGTGGLYRMHDLLRQFTREKLETLPDDALTHQRRFCQVYMEALAGWSERLKSADQVRVLEEMTLEQDHFRLAWDWAIQHGNVELQGQALDGLCRYYRLYSHNREGLQVCRQSIKFLEKDQIQIEIRVIITILQQWQVAFLVNQGDIQSALQILDPLVQFLQEKAKHMPEWEYQLANTCVQLASIQTINPTLYILELAQQSLSFFRSLNNPWEIAWALTTLAEVHDRLGNRQECYRTAMEALEILGQKGDPSLITRSKTSLFMCYLLGGEYQPALKLAGDLVNYHNQVGENYARSRVSYLQVYACFAAGQFTEARTALSQYFENLNTPDVFQNVGRKKPEAIMKYFEAMINLMTGQYTDALEIAAALVSSTEKGLLKPVCLAVVGTLYILRGESLQAIPYLEFSQQIYQQMPRKDHIGWPLSFLSLANYQMQDFNKARSYMIDALEFAAQYPMFMVFHFCLADLALILAEKGEIEQAVELYAAVISHPWAKNSALFYDLYQQHIDALAAGLSPEVTQAARQRGTGQNLQHLAQKYLLLLRENPDFCIPR